jgi:hypothetical protein
MFETFKLGAWKIGIYLEFGAWNLEIKIITIYSKKGGGSYKKVYSY